MGDVNAGGPLSDGLSTGLHELRAEMRAGFTAVDRRFEALEAGIEARITEEAETTRRYFDIMVEQVKDRVKIIAEGVSHHGTVLDDHEHRLKTLERTPDL